MEASVQTNNLNNNINFNGAFRIKPAENKAKAEIPLLFTQGRQIFHDVLEKGDEFIVVRDNYDKRIGAYIKENDVREIEYYPQINTKSGLDAEEPQGLLDLVKENVNKVITDIQEIFDIAITQKKPPKVYKSQNEVDRISNALRLNIEKPVIISTKEMTKIRDEHKKRTIEVIMQDPSSRYVHVIPDSLNESSIKCIISSKGEVVKYFDTPRLMRRFLVKFNELKQNNVNIIDKK